ncbi:MAG: radical SAM protein [DPANN group archaeon]|nr:radical SAM protein [DPANN group archaeon]
MKVDIPPIDKLRVLLTSKCNLDCIYCHKEGQYQKRANNLEINELIKIISLLVPYGLNEVKLSGGEPLLYDGIEKIIKSCKERGIKKVSISTNGILLKNKINLLKESGLDEISISLDTLKPELFKQLCKGTDKQYLLVKDGIMSAINNIPLVNLNMTLIKDNIDEVKDMIKFSKKLGVDLRLISLIEFSSDMKKLNLNVDIKDILDYLNKNSITKSSDIYPVYMDYIFKDNQKVTFVDSSCSDCDLCAKSYALRLTSDGKLKPCLVSEIGEIDILTAFRKNDLVTVKQNIEKAIFLKKLGLINYFPIFAKK